MYLAITLLLVIAVIAVAFFREGEEKRKEICFCVLSAGVLYAFVFLFNFGHSVGAGDLKKLQETHAENLEQDLQAARYSILANLAPDLDSSETYTVLGLGRDGKGYNVSDLAMVKGSKGEPQLYRLPQSLIMNRSLKAGVGLQYDPYSRTWSVIAPRSNNS